MDQRRSYHVVRTTLSYNYPNTPWWAIRAAPGGRGTGAFTAALHFRKRAACVRCFGLQAQLQERLSLLTRTLSGSSLDKLTLNLTKTRHEKQGAPLCFSGFFAPGLFVESFEFDASTNRGLPSGQTVCMTLWWP